MISYVNYFTSQNMCAEWHLNSNTICANVNRHRNEMVAYAFVCDNHFMSMNIKQLYDLLYDINSSSIMQNLSLKRKAQHYM